jgi:hypothetical protein
MLLRLAARLDPTRDISAVIYGTILTGATIVAVAEGTHNALEMAVTVVVTLMVFWVAHAYAEALGNPRGGVPSWVALEQELAAESPLVLACVVPLAALLVARALGASFDLATSVAVALSIALLFNYGLLSARRAHTRTAWQITAGMVYGLLGVVIFVLKITFVH